jgi:hypothetical protein
MNEIRWVLIGFLYDNGTFEGEALTGGFKQFANLDELKKFVS